ncbi:hypothetical protein PINS_up009023 [Pythium insidiosum]|nr:hypothetical protein PINS_up009023 [Pythium insidiosum]
MERDEMQQSSLASLTDEKLARFVLGQQKKTKFEKEREEREARKRKADAEAAAIYATFVASFEDDGDDIKGKAFVRAGRSTEDDRRDDVYRLQGTGSTRRREMDRMLEEMKQREQANDTHGPVRKRRQIDLFLDEIKSRDSSAPTHDDSSHMKGSFDDGDPFTTNLYVGNLAPTTTEETLERAFGRFGRIFSIKIMWPRTDEERQRRRNCGFVSFFRRDDADAARVQLNETELDGQTIVVGWGKAVKIDTAAPAFTASSSATSMDQHPSSTIQVQLPVDPKTRQRIDWLAQFVAKDGLEFENEIRRRERENPDYSFLFDTTQRSTDAVYYRWRVYSLAMAHRRRHHRYRRRGPVEIVENEAPATTMNDSDSVENQVSLSRSSYALAATQPQSKSKSQPTASLAWSPTVVKLESQPQPQSQSQSQSELI